jgi:spore cortex formation protein SpoVR/YcgB (stage V sporulation)
MSGNGGAIAIANLVKLCPQIEDFRFSATRSMNEGCIAVAKVTIVNHNYSRSARYAAVSIEVFFW